MTISGIMNAGLSALSANQAALRATSTNVSNVNTAGYSRLETQFVSRNATGGVEGVDVDIQRVASNYLAAAEWRSAADVSAASVSAAFYDRAQSLFGDPTSSTSVFAALDPVFTSFGSLAVDPESALRRSTSLSEVNALLSRLDSTAGNIAALRDEADGRVRSVVTEANTLMSGIAALNTSIQSARIGGLSASQAESEQARMLDRLAEIVDIRVQQRELGGVEVRTGDGMLLVDREAATMVMNDQVDGQPYSGVALQQPRSQTPLSLQGHLSSGELQGLLTARDRDLVDLQQAFGEYAGGVVATLNAGHNAGSAVPAPNSLTGRNDGLIDTDSLGFSGVTRIAVLDADGVTQRQLEIDFDASSITDETGTVTAFADTIGDFVFALDSALGGAGDASFAGGQLTLGASSSTGGVVIQDDPHTPATRTGLGFSNAFGLNDLVSGGGRAGYATGLSSSDEHGFAAGGTMTFAMRDASGAIVRTVDYTVLGGGDVAALQAELDTALAGYARTSLDANGRLTLVPTLSGVNRIDVLNDTTARGDTSMSLSGLFGLGEGIGPQRAVGLEVRSDIQSDPSRIATAVASLDTSTFGVGTPIAAGDGGGALAIEEAARINRNFGAAGGMAGQSSSITDYASRLAGHVGARSEAASDSQAARASVREEIGLRRQSEEGVNLDEELVKMTTYQQAYSAASRLIQAARDMYDVVLQMV